MNRSALPSLLATAAMLLAVLVAACASAATPQPPPVATPPTVSGATSPAPTTAGSAATGFHVELHQATGNAVTIDIIDASGTLVAATSGTPGDGATVEPYTVAVENDDPSTLRLTWVGGPCDSANSLAVDATGHQFLLVQPECPGDAIATDRVLVLRFSGPIAADGIEAFLQDGLDTPA
ncbi:MAG TPA: hypothetical protein VFO73_09100 [Candidatus Limnocylindrales bacterium]|nr:hypothetical protein [Candidatus Limnocylindrales bacterium]